MERVLGYSHSVAPFAWKRVVLRASAYGFHRSSEHRSVIFSNDSLGILSFSSKAGERIRTVDIQLGKLSLYQLSYTRVNRIVSYSVNNVQDASRLYSSSFLLAMVVKLTQLNTAVVVDVYQIKVTLACRPFIRRQSQVSVLVVFFD